MKKLLFLWFVSLSIQMNAQSADDVATISLKSAESEIKIGFKSANDFAENSDQVLNNIADLVEVGNPCDVTIVISVKTPAEKSPMLNGKPIAKWTNTTVNAACDTMEATAKQARDAALRELRG